MSRYTLSLFLLLLSISKNTQAQDSLFSQNFEEYIKHHLQKDVYEIDSTAEAVILYEKAAYNQNFEFNSWTKKYRRVRRIIKLLSKDATHLGDVELEDNYSFGVISNIYATAYNLVGGKVQATRLRKKDMVTVGPNDKWTKVRFSMADVRPGSIIDVSYDQEFEWGADVEWEFEGHLPKLYVEVRNILPKNRAGMVMLKSDHKFVDLGMKEPGFIAPDTLMAYTYELEESMGFCNAWVRRNVAAYEDEQFTMGLGNYIESISIAEPEGYNKWEDVNRVLNHRHMLGPAHRRDSLLRITADSITAGMHTETEKLKALFTYVRDVCKPPKRFRLTIYFTRESLENALTSWKALNHLLVLLAREAGLQSNMVVVASAYNRRVSANIPRLSAFSHAVCRIKADDSVYYLDASDKGNMFGQLPWYFYNGFSWVVDSVGYPVNLFPEMVKERHVVSVRTQSKDPDNYVLAITEAWGAVQSPICRQMLKKDSTALTQALTSKLRQLPLEPELLSVKINNQSNVDTTLSIDYTIKLKWPEDEHFVLIPSLVNYFTETPFRNEKRRFPVEWPSAIDYIYSMYIELPEKFTINELPKSTTLKLGDNNQYNYGIAYDSSNNALNLNTRFRMRDTHFPPNQYAQLREFCDNIIQLQQQACLIRKK